jgi:hypothetical protein
MSNTIPVDVLNTSALVSCRVQSNADDVFGDMLDCLTKLKKRVKYAAFNTFPISDCVSQTWHILYKRFGVMGSFC